MTSSKGAAQSQRRRSRPQRAFSRWPTRTVGPTTDASHFDAFPVRRSTQHRTTRKLKALKRKTKRKTNRAELLPGVLGSVPTQNFPGRGACARRRIFSWKTQLGRASCRLTPGRRDKPLGTDPGTCLYRAYGLLSRIGVAHVWFQCYMRRDISKLSLIHI